MPSTRITFFSKKTKGDCDCLAVFCTIAHCFSFTPTLAKNTKIQLSICDIENTIVKFYMVLNPLAKKIKIYLSICGTSRRT